MEDVRFEELKFQIGRCAECARDVLTYLEVDDATGDEHPCCVHCAQPVELELREARGDELPVHGYGLLETQGCGNPGCGGGQCSRRQNPH